jgi:hypothetical protein
MAWTLEGSPPSMSEICPDSYVGGKKLASVQGFGRKKSAHDIEQFKPVSQVNMKSKLI